MPCLLFSRIVPSFNQKNVSSLVPLNIIGVLYGVVGASMAWIIKQFFWVPHRFRYGILFAGGWGNYGDIRTFSLPDTFPSLSEFVCSDGHRNGNHFVGAFSRCR